MPRAARAAVRSILVVGEPDLAVGAAVFGLLAVAGVLLAGDAPMRETLSESWHSLARRGRTA